MNTDCVYPDCHQQHQQDCYCCGQAYCANHLRSDLIRAHFIGPMLVLVCQACYLARRQPPVPAQPVAQPPERAIALRSLPIPLAQ